MSGECPACLNGCGGARLDCPMREGGPKVKPAIGRPRLYTQDVADELCERMAEGRSLRSVVSDPDMPSWTTVWRWLQSDDSFRAQYARTREVQAHYIAEKAIDEAAAATDAGLGRLAFDARKWFASKLAPKVYGEKIEVDQNVRMAVVSAEPLTESDWVKQHGSKDG